MAATHEIPVVWLQASTCSGCSVSVLNASAPKITDLLQLFVLAIVENLGYRQLSAWWRLKGTISVLRGVQGWGHMQRRGFTASEREAA